MLGRKTNAGITAFAQVGLGGVASLEWPNFAQSCFIQKDQSRIVGPAAVAGRCRKAVSKIQTFTVSVA